MRYLLDTHTLVWWWTEQANLSHNALQSIINPYHHIFVSPMNLWEMSIKYHKGKWDEVGQVLVDFEKMVVRNEFGVMPIKLSHTYLAGKLPQAHADPFDRMLVATAISEKLILISKDEKLRQFDVDILW